MTSPHFVLYRAHRMETSERTPRQSQPLAFKHVQDWIFPLPLRGLQLEHLTDHEAGAWQGLVSGLQTQEPLWGTGDRPPGSAGCHHCLAPLTAPFEVQRMGLAPPKQAVNQAGERKLSTAAELWWPWRDRLHPLGPQAPPLPALQPPPAPYLPWPAPSSPQAHCPAQLLHSQCPSS